MNSIANHEPETKGFNKARDFQDAIIRARKNGCADPLEAAEEVYDWFLNAPRSVQITTLQYAAARMWSVVSDKMEGRQLSSDCERVTEIEVTARTETKLRDKPAIRQAAISAEQRDSIKAKVAADLERQWLDLVIPMTGAQVRAAKLLPDEMVRNIPDYQRVGDVFTADQLRASRPKV